MRCEHGSLALGWIAGHLLWAVRVGELSLQLDLRVCCAGLTFSVCVPGAQGERGHSNHTGPFPCARVIPRRSRHLSGSVGLAVWTPGKCWSGYLISLQGKLPASKGNSPGDGKRQSCQCLDCCLKDAAMGIFSSSPSSRDAVVQLSLDCRALPD